MTIYRQAPGWAGAAMLPLALAACNAPAAQEDPPEPVASATPEPDTSATPEAEASEVARPDLDYEALSDHEDPERLLRFYAEAVRLNAWNEAARAWSTDAEMTAEKLEAAYGEGGAPGMVFGKGDNEGAAGMLFYVAPVVVDFAGDKDAERRGTIVLRRANDVPGASAEQLDWKIERSDVLVPASE